MDRNGVYNFPVSFFTDYQNSARPGYEADLMGKHPYVLKVLFSASKKYEDVDLKETLSDLKALDEKLKSTNLDAKYLIEEFLVQFLSKKNAGKISNNI